MHDLELETLFFSKASYFNYLVRYQEVRDIRTLLYPLEKRFESLSDERESKATVAASFKI